jgi:hypothetical protein
LALAVAGLVLAGCSDQQSKPTTYGPTGKDMLLDLAEFIKWYPKEHKRVPSQAAELAAVEPLYPTAHLGVVSKQIVYLWGVGLSSGGPAGDTVLAYEKDVEAKGGWVLMQDGTVKEMTPDQFKSAPKARR